ncbi:MAG: hypothetical protein ACLTE2_07170 [Eubacteriales bacterium]
MRIEKTKAVLDKTDVAVVVFSDMQMELETQWIAMLRQRKIPILAVVNQVDRIEQVQEIKRQIEQRFSLTPLLVSAKEKTGISQMKHEILRLMPPDFEAQSLTGSLVQPEDVVLLVMPQDKQAPKGRLILPQVQTIRDLLDNHCVVMCVYHGTIVHRAAGACKTAKMNHYRFPGICTGLPFEARRNIADILFYIAGSI